MKSDVGSQDLTNLKRTNSELKRALKHFIEVAPAHGTLSSQINNIKEALKSNEAMFTFASLVEQYAKMKKNFDNVDYQNEQRDFKAVKLSLKKLTEQQLSSEQLEKIDEIMLAIAENAPAHQIMAKLGKTLTTYGATIASLRQDSPEVVAKKDIETDETNVVAADIHLASKRLQKDVAIVAKQLAKTYPDDDFIAGIITESDKLAGGKGTFFAAINLLERTTTYITLLIQKERCAAEEMLNDIHANLVDAFNRTSVIEKLVESAKDERDTVKKSMVLELKNMEVKARTIDSIEGMQTHIKDSVALLSRIMNDYADTQNKIHQTNETTIQALSHKIERTSTFVDTLEKKLNVAEEVSLIDELTTIGNRKGYVLRINKERKEWSTTKQPLSILLIDVDNFKSINDNYGHSIGDQVLKCLGQTLNKHVRSTDYVARYGGEEFVIILPATDLKTCVKIAQKIQSVINSLKFELRRKNKVLKITASFGIAKFTEQTANTTEVFNLADKALYHAKDTGRDRIVVAQGEELVVVDKEAELSE